MAAPTQSAALSVNDCKLRKLLTDPNDGAATYDEWVDVPDIVNFTLEFDTDEKERRGDGVVKEKISTITGITLTAECSSLDLNVLSILTGGTVTTSGTGDAESVKFVYGGAATPSYVQIEAQCTRVGAGLGDIHLSVYKAQVTTPPQIGFTDDDFVSYEFELGAVARNSDNNIYEYVFNETATAIDPA